MAMSVAKQIEEIEQAKDEADERFDSLLRSQGWKQTSGNPASIWLWEKTMPGGKVVMVERHTALDLERVMSYQAQDMPM
jgi:hypothetical protein